MPREPLCKDSLPIDKVRRFLVGERSAVPGHRHTNIFVLRAGDTPLNALRAYDARCGIDANIYDPHGTRYAALVAKKRDAALLYAARAVNPLLVGWWQRSGSTGVLLAQACGARARLIWWIRPLSRTRCHILVVRGNGCRNGLVERFSLRQRRSQLARGPLRRAASCRLNEQRRDHRLCALRRASAQSTV